MLDRAVDRLVAAGAMAPLRGTAVLAAGAHAVARLGVTPYADQVGEHVLAARAGLSLGAVAAGEAGLPTVVLDGGRATGDLLHADALSLERVRVRVRVRELLAEGLAAGRDAPGDVVALGEVGIGNTTVAAALSALLLRRPAGRGRRGARNGRRCRHAPAQGRGRGWRAGVVLGAAERRAVVVLDGLATSVCALLAVRTDPGCSAYLVAGQRSRERAHGLVLDELGLEPLLDLRLRAGEGAGAALAVRLLSIGLEIRLRTAQTRDAAPPGTGPVAR